MEKNIKNSLITILTASLLVSCSSTLVPVENLTPQELIQYGQNEYEASNYQNALYYYNTAIDKFGDQASVFVEARYETGHIYMKKKDYTNAVAAFDEVIYVYDHAPAGTVPAAYTKLSKIELAKIPESKVTQARAEIEKARKEAESEKN